MRKLNVKRTMVFVILLVVVLLSSKVYATGVISPLTVNTTTSTTNEVTMNTINQVANQTTIAPTTNTAVSTYTNTNLPQTGDASDYAIFLLIAVSIVVAVYAYKKVRDYNI